MSEKSKTKKNTLLFLLCKCQNPEKLKINCQGHRYVLISALARERWHNNPGGYNHLLKGFYKNVSLVRACLLNEGRKLARGGKKIFFSSTKHRSDVQYINRYAVQYVCAIKI